MASRSDHRYSGYVSVRTLAEEFDVTQDTVRRWIRNGRLPAYQIAGSVRVKREDAEKMTRPVDVA